MRISKKVDKKVGKQMRIDAGWHRIFKMGAAYAGVSIRELVEACFAEGYEQVKKDYGLKDNYE